MSIQLTEAQIAGVKTVLEKYENGDHYVVIQGCAGAG